MIMKTIMIIIMNEDDRDDGSTCWCSIARTTKHFYPGHFFHLQKGVVDDVGDDIDVDDIDVDDDDDVDKMEDLLHIPGSQLQLLRPLCLPHAPGGDDF